MSTTLTACFVASPIPPNSSTPYMPQWVSVNHDNPDVGSDGTSPLSRMACEQNLDPPDAPSRVLQEALSFSPGDTMRIYVPQGDQYSGLYVVDADGAIKLPFLPPIQVLGQSAAALERRIADLLVQAKLFQPSFVQVSVQPMQWAPVQITVSGAVFQPGMVIINERKTDERGRPEGAATGDYAPGRLLTNAVRNAGGIRPDADIAHVVVLRQGQRIPMDLRGALTAQPFSNPSLISGDQVDIPSLGCFQEALMRPSAISPLGIRIYASTLTTPANSNSMAGISKDSVSFPYGTRLLQALVSINCVGGNTLTNADRMAVLVTANPVTGKSEAIQRSVEQLVHEPGRDAFNPYLLPNDAVACYESGFATFRDVAKALVDFIAPTAGYH
ncbi:MAG: polysaccharide biosynthesis/export family protein [Pseudomonadota bacterium]